MINKQKKFTISNFSNEELGGKNYLMQTIEDKDKTITEKPKSESKIEEFTKNYEPESILLPILGKVFRESLDKLSKQNNPDSQTLDANENKVIAIILQLAIEKPELLTNPANLMKELNDRRSMREGVTEGIIPFTTVDNSLAMQLEKALKADGKLLKADGNIDIETLTATVNLIADNIPAIEKSGIIGGAAVLIGQVLKNTGSSLGTESNLDQKTLDMLNKKLEQKLKDKGLGTDIFERK
jgi:hypothetical protein